MKKPLLLSSLALLVASVCAVFLVMGKPENRVAQDLRNHGVIRATSDLQFVVKSNDLRENAFLFEVKADGVVVAANDRMPLRIRGVDQANSESGLKSLRSTLERRLNRVLNEKAHSIWSVESDEMRASQVFLIEEPDKSFLLVAYH